MSSGNVLRFVLLGAAGFGLGGAVLGASLLTTNPVVATPVSALLAGAVGGAFLGLALKDRRRAIALALLGALGLIAGGFATLLAFLLFVSDSGPAGLSAMGVIGGSIIGATLGLAFLDWKRMVILALAGASGLAAGASAGFLSLRTLFGESLLFGPAGTGILLTVTGVVGGALLGAALGYLEWAARQPRGAALLRLSALGGLMAGGILFAAFFALPYMSICGREERAALAEFPQYGSVEEEPISSPVSGGCAVSYDTPDSPRQVSTYFAEQLTEHGWTVEHRLEAGAEEEFEGTLVRARRDGLTYEAGYESLQFYDPPRPGTHVAVHLWEDEKRGARAAG